MIKANPSKNKLEEENLGGWAEEPRNTHYRNGSLFHQLQENLARYEGTKHKKHQSNASMKNLKLPFIGQNPTANNYSKKKTKKVGESK